MYLCVAFKEQIQAQGVSNTFNKIAEHSILYYKKQNLPKFE